MWSAILGSFFKSILSTLVTVMDKWQMRRDVMRVERAKHKIESLQNELDVIQKGNRVRNRLANANFVRRLRKKYKDDSS